MAARKAAATLDGGVEKLKNGLLSGWASAGGTPLSLDIIVDGVSTITVIADRAREGAAAGRSDGFKLKLPDRLGDGKPHSLVVRSSAGAITKEPMSFSFIAEPPPPPKASPPEQTPLKLKAGQRQAPWSPEVAAFVAEAYSGGGRKSRAAETIGALLASAPIAAVRKLSVEDIASAADSPAQLTLWVDVGAAEQTAVESTLASWALCGSSAPILFKADDATSPSLDEIDATVVAQGDLKAPKDGFVVIARAGDTFHPTLRSLVAALPASVAGLSWDVALQAPGEPIAERVLRRSASLAIAMGALDLAGVGFAVAARGLNTTTPSSGSLARFMQAASTSIDGAWLHAPEILSSTLTKPDGSLAAQGTLASDAVAKATPALRLLQAEPVPVLAPAAPSETVAIVLCPADAVEAEGLLAALAQQSLKGEIVVVVDSAAQAKAVTAAGDAAFGKKKVTVVQAPPEEGVAERLNRGVEATTADTLVLLAGVTGFASDVVLEGLAAWAAAPGVGAAISKVVVPSVPAKRARHGLLQADPGDRMACAAISRRSWGQVGDFDSQSFPNLFGAAWMRKAERHSLINLRVDGLTATATLAGMPTAAESLLLRTVHAPRPNEREAPEVTVANEARAAFLAGKLLEARQEALRLRQEVLSDVSGLHGIADDLRTSFETLGLKLDRS